LLCQYTFAAAVHLRSRLRTVCIGVLVRLLRVSLLHMSPFTNILHSHSNVLLHMSQSRTLQIMAQSLFVLLCPSLNSNFILHAIFVVGIAYGVHIGYSLGKVKSLLQERITALSFAGGFPKCAALLVWLYHHVQHFCSTILFYIGFVFWSLFLDSRGSKALMKRYCIGLALLMLLPVSNAVCPFCHGAAEQFGCKGTSADCPFNTGVVANTANLVSTAAGAVITVASLLPLWVSRLFSRDKLNVILALAKRSQSGVQAFDPTGLKHPDLIDAVKTGLWAKEDAIHYCEIKASEVDLSPTLEDKVFRAHELEQKNWHRTGDAIRRLPVYAESRLEDESNTSAMLYNLALLSERVCGSGGAKKDAIDLSVCSEAEESDKVTGSKAKQMTASLKRPTSELQMSRLFSMWSLVCHATGICTCLVLLAFLDEVVYKPVADGLYTWEVAFEIVLQYLQEVEASNGLFCIGNIRQKLGGIDAVRAAATSKAKEVHGKSIFRALGGNPGPSNELPAEATIKGNTGSKRGCASWNLGNRHSATHLDASGRCKFAHKCDAVLTETDANGAPKHCLNSAGTAGHKRGQCDNPKKK
jgi:hypothetical protein